MEPHVSLSLAHTGPVDRQACLDDDDHDDFKNYRE